MCVIVYSELNVAHISAVIHTSFLLPVYEFVSDAVS